MLAAAQRRPSSYQAGMLAMADRLFREYDNLPVRTVFRAIGSARAALRQHGETVPGPERVERLAREQLRTGVRAVSGS